jgi:nifR3 family TIM-barrel protein
VAVYGDTLLAPMDGFSDWPFRSICRALGSAVSYTSFVNAMDLLAGTPAAQRGVFFEPAEQPVVVQVFDSDEARLTAAARLIAERRPDGIDVNMGCSTRCVAGRGAGAGLLKDPHKIGRIIQALARAVPQPITAKIRLGWDNTHRNYLDVAHAIEDNGGRLIAVHARTRAQAYRGQADWDAIAEIRQAVAIPVVGSGDVATPQDIDRMLAHTGCQAVMIGRAARGNPWLLQRRARQTVPDGEVAAVLHLHLHRMLTFYGNRDGVLRFRKHAALYLAPADVPPELRRQILTTPDPAHLRDLLARAGFPHPGDDALLPYRPSTAAWQPAGAT